VRKNRSDTLNAALLSGRPNDCIFYFKRFYVPEENLLVEKEYDSTLYNIP